MVTKGKQVISQPNHQEAETIKSALFEGLLSSKQEGKRYHYVCDYGLSDIREGALFNDLQPAAIAIFQLLFRHGLHHNITSRGLRISITPDIWRIAPLERQQ